MEEVLIITYYWPPAGGPGVQRWLKMSKYLPEFGVKPVILTVDPEQATYPLRDESLLQDVAPNLEVIRTATSELFGTYKKASGRGEVPFSGFANETDRPGPRQILARWVRGNFFLPDPRRGWNSYAIRKALELIDSRNIRTVITTSPPHSTQLIGRALRKARGIRWIADFRDPWTDIYYYNRFYPTRLARAIDAGYERKVLEEADLVLGVSDALNRLLQAKVSKNRDNFRALPNGFDEEDFSGPAPEKEDGFVLTYTGTLAEQYPLDGLIRAVENLPADYRERFRLRFIGRRDEATEKRLAVLPWVERLSSTTHHEAINAMRAAHALLLVIPSIPTNEGILTGKIFEYLAAGNPVLGIGPVNGDAASLLRETGAGEMRDYHDATGLSTLLKNWMDGHLPQPTGKSAGFSRKQLAGRLAGMIRQPASSAS